MLAPADNSGAKGSVMVDGIDNAWVALQNRLEIRSRELQLEVRIYPTPIARCDEQLTKVIAERDAVFRQLRLARDLDGTRSAVASDEWFSRLREFAIGLELSDDVVMAGLRERIIAGLER
jgi:hypothetical protein